MLHSGLVEYTRTISVAGLAVFLARPGNYLGAPRVGSRFMGKIVAIGGGDFRTGETLALDQEVIRLTGRSRPRALFIPTASSDSFENWEAFRAAYGGELGCDAYVLNLLATPPSSRELAEARSRRTPEASLRQRHRALRRQRVRHLLVQVRA